TPHTEAVAINVLDTFNAGGGQNKNSSKNHQTEFGNLLMYSGSRWTVKVGSQGVVRRNHSFSQNNFTGSWTFSSLNDYLCVTGFGCADGASATPTQFTRTFGDPRLDVNQFEFAGFIQNDFKVSKKFNLSFGLRFEDQTNISDHNNIDPRMGFAYQLAKSTVIRGGLGVFHDRFAENTVEQLLRLDGTRQFQIIVRNPANYPLIPDGGVVPSTLRTRSADVVNPYNLNESLSIEQAIWKSWGVTLSWDAQRGVHLLRSRNINAPLADTGLRPDPSQG